MKNLDHFQKITIVLVTFKSQHIIEKCLDNLDEKYNKILIENSNDVNFTDYLEKKYKNLKCYNTGYDAGFGPAVNIGFEKSKTEYIISMNPDSFPEKGCFEKLIKTAEHYDQVGMVTPITYVKNNSKESRQYGYFNKNIKPIKDSNNKLFVDYVSGNVFLIKKDLIEEIGKFDENIFSEFEEVDFQRRIFNVNKKIIIDFDAKSQHLEGKSADPKYDFEMKCETSWHHSWSMFYYYKKHWGFIYAFAQCFPLAIINILKAFLSILKGNKKNYVIYKLLFLGFLNSLFNKKSFYRAEID